MYFRSLGLTEVTSLDTSEECYWQLARLYTLADKFDVRLLKESIIDELFAIGSKPELWPPQPDVVTYIYENTTEQSPLRELMVGWYVWHIDQDWYTLSGSRAFLADTPMFAADVAIAMSRKAEDPSLKSPISSEPFSYYEDRAKSLGD